MGLEERVKGTESTIWVEELESRHCYKRRRKWREGSWKWDMFIQPGMRTYTKTNLAHNEFSPGCPDQDKA